MRKRQTFSFWSLAAAKSCLPSSGHPLLPWLRDLAARLRDEASCNACSLSSSRVRTRCEGELQKKGRVPGSEPQRQLLGEPLNPTQGKERARQLPVTRLLREGGKATQRDVNELPASGGITAGSACLALAAAASPGVINCRRAP